MTKAKGIHTLELFHTAVILILMFGFGQLPAIEPITPLGMKIIGIFLAMLYGWSTVGLIWPSLLGMLAIAFSGYAPLKTIWATSFGNDNVVQFIFIFVFAGAVEAHGITRFIAFWLLSRKGIEGKPWMFSFVYLFAISLLGALTSSSPAIILGWSILYSIFDTLGYKRGDRYVSFMIFGTILAAQLGMGVMPFKSAPLMILASFEAIAGARIDYLAYMAFMAVAVTAAIALYILAGKHILRLDINALRNLKQEDVVRDRAVLQLNLKQKVVFTFLVGLVVLMILPSILPAAWPLTALLNTLGATGISVALVALMCIISIDGEKLLNFQLMAKQHINWGVLLLLAAVMVISGALNHDSVGFVSFLKVLLEPVFGQASAVFFVVMMVLCAVIFTNFCNNAATAIALLPVVLAFAATVGIDSSLTAVVIIFAVMLAFLTPAASPSAALLHSNDWISKKDIYMMGSMAIGASIIVLLAAAFTVGKILF